jgi:hypothetical protein
MRRRILLTVTGMMALALSAPGAALAASHHHHNSKHHVHHARVSFRHAARVSFRHLGPLSAGAGAPGGSTSTSPTTKPTTTTPTPTPTEENAGEVTSYTGGVLTLKLGNNSEVSGKVTINTRFHCISATTSPTPGATTNQQGPGDDDGWGDDQGGASWQNDQGSPQGGGQWQGGDGGNNGSPGNWGNWGHDEEPISNEPPCDSGALTPGTKVRAAELRIAPPGAAEFMWITLVS